MRLAVLTLAITVMAAARVFSQASTSGATNTPVGPASVTVRHCGFLVGYEHAAGDPTAVTEVAS